MILLACECLAAEIHQKSGLICGKHARSWFSAVFVDSSRFNVFLSSMKFFFESNRATNSRKFFERFFPSICFFFHLRNKIGSVSCQSTTCEVNSIKPISRWINFLHEFIAALATFSALTFIFVKFRRSKRVIKWTKMFGKEIFEASFVERPMNRRRTSELFCRLFWLKKW